MLIQFLPYGRDHRNPPVVQDAPWKSAEAHRIAQRACYDCHSNETLWPWYTNIAPMSWLVQRDVLEGRHALNFSTWGQGEQEMEEIARTVQRGEMPPRQYILIHPAAKLSSAEKEILLSGLPGISATESGEEGE